MLSTFEIVIYALLNYIPYVALAIYPVRKYLVFSKKALIPLFVFSCFFQVVLLILGEGILNQYAEILSYISTIYNIVLYIFVTNCKFGRIVFNSFMITNIANFVLIASKYLEHLFFPDMVYDLYRWSFSLSMLIVQIIVLIPFSFYVRFLSDSINEYNKDSPLWNYVWLIPTTFYVIWFYVFFHISNVSLLEASLIGKNIVFNFIIVLGQLLIYTGVSALLYSSSQVQRLESESHQLSLQALQYKNIQEHINDVRIVRHDLKHHVAVMSTMIENGEYDRLKNYLDKFNKNLSNMGQISYCSNQLLNMALVYYAQLCKLNNVDFEFSLKIPDTLPLSDSDLTVLFGNLLENATDACIAQSTDEKKLTLNAAIYHDQLVVTLDNSYDNPITKDASGNFVTTKEHGNGLGTKSVKQIVKNYGGSIEFDASPTLFCVSFIIPLS